MFFPVFFFSKAEVCALNLPGVLEKQIESLQDYSQDWQIWQKTNQPVLFRK